MQRSRYAKIYLLVQGSDLYKVQDRFEYPSSINLAEFLDESADRSRSWDYMLHSVIVHDGDPSSGHYTILITPEKDGRWFKFDDDRVTPALECEAFEDNFGGNTNGAITGGNQTRRPTQFKCAYILVYVRSTDINTLLSPVTDSDVPDFLSKRTSSLCVLLIAS